MMFTHEIAELTVVVLPVAIIAISNVALALTGETGTLLLPSPALW